MLSVLLATGRQAHAEDHAPESVTRAYSAYEQVAIHDAERLLGAKVDPVAEGKTVESIETVRLDPVEPRDPFPGAVNVVHTTTREDVVLHEVLLRIGEPYRAVIADESARNLRQFAKVSIVICLALQGSRPDRVRVVVITKDVWSLIADVDFHVTKGGPEYLMFEAEETNVAGQQYEISARSIIRPESYSLGAAYAAPRFAQRFLTLHAEANVIINRASGNPEGSFGDARIERPLYSTRSPWAWSTGVTWQDEVYRRYSNASVATYEGALPWVWRARRIEEQVSGTRSTGWASKRDVTIGANIVRDVYRVPDATRYDAALVRTFTDTYVPVGETRVFPYVQWRAYRNDFLRTINVETMSLQEDFRLGYDLLARAYPVTEAVGSTRNLMGVRLGGMYTLALGDGFVRGLVDTITEVEETRIPDASVRTELRVVSPQTPIGRIIFDIDAVHRWRNYLNRTSVLGGEDRLRGWPTRYFVGPNVFAMNLELRTRPIDLAGVQVGGSAFYDVGRAFSGGFDRIQPAQSVGFGLRVVLPQIDRVVIRGDFGFPIAAGGLPPDIAPMSFFFAFHQAFQTNHIPVPFGP